MAASPEGSSGAGVALLDYEILTADGVLRKGEARSLSASGLEGDFVLGARHAPFITILRSGTLKVDEEGGGAAFEIRGGFLEVFGGRARVLAEIEDEEN